MRKTVQTCPKLSGKPSFAKEHPDKVKYWHPTKNKDITPDDVLPNSGMKMWWICDNGHEYQVSVCVVSKGIGCNECRTAKALKKFGSFAGANPELVSEWHPTKNGDKTPFNTQKDYNTEVWWICKLNHEWEARPGHRTNNRGGSCPYCNNRSVLKGFNDFKTTKPELAKKFSVSNKKNPDEIRYIKGHEYYWTCREHGEYYVSMEQANKGKGCEQCEIYYRSLGVKEPRLLKEWDYKLNNKEDFDPYKVSANNTANVNWVCEYGHKWKAQVCSRTTKVRCQTNCPVCSGFTVLPGFNDLETLHPDIAKEFDIEANGTTPDKVYAYGDKRWTWKCNKGHTWKTKATHRTKANTGCRRCVAKQSKAECELFSILNNSYPEIEQGRRDILDGSLELDIYSNAGWAIEFNGIYWHDPVKYPKVVERHERKERICNDKNIQLIIVWEDDWNKDKKKVISDIHEMIKNQTVYDNYGYR